MAANGPVRVRVLVIWPGRLLPDRARPACLMAGAMIWMLTALPAVAGTPPPGHGRDPMTAMSPAAAPVPVLAVSNLLAVACAKASIPWPARAIGPGPLVQGPTGCQPGRDERRDGGDAAHNAVTPTQDHAGSTAHDHPDHPFRRGTGGFPANRLRRPERRLRGARHAERSSESVSRAVIRGSWPFLQLSQRILDSCAVRLGTGPVLRLLGVRD